MLSPKFGRNIKTCPHKGMSRGSCPLVAWHSVQMSFTCPLRRQLLAGAASSLLVPSLLRAEVIQRPKTFWERPRELWLYRPFTREEVRAVYYAEGQVQWDGYRQLCTLLRDAQTGEAVQMSRVLLDILTGLQGYMAAIGQVRPLRTHSGYRSLKTNARTEGAVRNSLHTQGRAWDGRFEGLPAEYASSIARYLQGGGVGFYKAADFVHVDDGRQRFWRG